MAEGTSSSVDDLVCPPFLHSSVEDSESCQLPHVSTRRSTDNTCHFYLLGKCRYGLQCWHSHSLKRDDPKFIALRNQILSARSNRRHDIDDEVFFQTENSADNSEKNGSRPKCGQLAKNRGKEESRHYNAPPAHLQNWVNAPEFVPRSARSYADTVKWNTAFENEEIDREAELCPFYLANECPYYKTCPLIHGDLCDICQKYCLHPFDEKVRQMHIKYCEKEFENDMELSFAIQCSLNKTCGICMDVILEKNLISERRFGILEKCNHVFCLDCIRKWRQARSVQIHNQVDSVLDPVVTRACPECRVSSDFIIPSAHWYENEEKKKKMIDDYKLALSKKPCKYFKQGKGKCPFGGSCFYLHAKPDGTKVELPPPKKRRIRQNQNSELDFIDGIFLWEYLELREENILLELDDYVSFISETDDDTSEDSDMIFFTEPF